MLGTNPPDGTYAGGDDEFVLRDGEVFAEPGKFTDDRYGKLLARELEAFREWQRSLPREGG